MKHGRLAGRFARRGLLVPLFLLLSGALAALGHAPFSVPVATVAGFAVAIRLAATASDWKTATVRGWLFGSGYFALVMVWIVEPFLVFPLRDGWLAPFAIFFMAGGLAIFWALSFGLAYIAGAGLRTRAAAFALTLTGAEALREVIFTGFPWGLPGTVWSTTPVGQIAAYVGPLGLTLLTVLAAAAIFADRRLWVGTVAVAASTGILWIAGNARLAIAIDEADALVVVRLVQPNVEQELKWSLDHQREFFDRLLQLTSAGTVTGQPPDVVIWPETAATFLLDNDDPRLSEIAAAASGGWVVLGIRRRVDRATYNSMAVISPEGEIAATYDKRKLVPFGEYIPFGDQLARWGVSGLATTETGAFSPGSDPAVISVKPLGQVLAVICYEAIFWSWVRRQERPDIMVQVTNDAWFGTFSGPQQHLEQARMRAIEMGVPLVRVANTGISAVFDARGVLAGQIELGEQGILDLEVPPALAPTVYSRTGHIPLLAICTMIAGFLLWWRFKKGR